MHASDLADKGKGAPVMDHGCLYSSNAWMVSVTKVDGTWDVATDVS